MTMFTTAAQPFAMDPKEAKKQKLESYRNYHQHLIDDLGISRMDFNIKMAFYNKQGRMVVGIFASEFKKEKGFFFELVTRDLEPADQLRRVYRIPPNEAFHEEYELNEKGSYLVPLEELRTINKDSVAISKGEAIKAMDAVDIRQQTAQMNSNPVTAYRAPATMEDAPAAEMTIRDYMAIHTGRPVSSRAWLNELINKQNK